MFFLSSFTDLLDNLRALFTFLFTCMTDMANFFTTNAIGIIILGCVVFSLIVKIVSHFLKNVK